jgi:hypothetical protein
LRLWRYFKMLIRISVVLTGTVTGYTLNGKSDYFLGSFFHFLLYISLFLLIINIFYRGITVSQKYGYLKHRKRDEKNLDYRRMWTNRFGACS